MKDTHTDWKIIFPKNQVYNKNQFQLIECSFYSLVDSVLAWRKKKPINLVARILTNEKLKSTGKTKGGDWKLYNAEIIFCNMENK